MRSSLKALPVFCALAASLASAQILNSERIELSFGSYGVDIIYSDERLRVSNLFSTHDGEQVTRTLAVVEYPEFLHAALADEHRKILNGGSIGSTFTEAGWQVIKQNLSIIEVNATEDQAGMMRVEVPVKLATHFYQLDVEKDGQRYSYAAIVEMHHPDYLNDADLMTTYALDPASPEDSRIGFEQSEERLRNHLRLMYLAVQVLRESNLALSE